MVLSETLFRANLSLKPSDKSDLTQKVCMSDCGTFITGASGFVLKSIPWYCFHGPKGFERLKEYVNLVVSQDAVNIVSQEAAQWKFLTDAPELVAVLKNRSSAFTKTINPTYDPLIQKVTKFSNLQPPALFQRPEVYQNNLLSKRFTQREVSQETLDREGRHIQIHGTTRSQYELNLLIQSAGKPTAPKTGLKRDEQFKIAAPSYSVPGDRRSQRQVPVKEFRELIYTFSGLEKPEKDLPNQAYKLIKKWTNLTNQKSFSEKQRLILSHSFGSSHTLTVMLLQIVKKLDDLVQQSGSSVSKSLEYERTLSMTGYISHLVQKLEFFHTRFFSTADWNSLSGEGKIRLVQDFYRTFSVMTSEVQVPYSDTSLLHFAPLEVVKQWTPLFADYKKRQTNLLASKNVSKDQELLANRDSFKLSNSKNNSNTSLSRRLRGRGGNWNTFRSNRGRGRGWNSRGRRWNNRGRGWYNRGRGNRGRGKRGRRGRKPWWWKPRNPKRNNQTDTNPKNPKKQKTEGDGT